MYSLSYHTDDILGGRAVLSVSLTEQQQADSLGADPEALPILSALEEIPGIECAWIEEQGRYYVVVIQLPKGYDGQRCPRYRSIPVEPSELMQPVVRLDFPGAIADGVGA